MAAVGGVHDKNEKRYSEKRDNGQHDLQDASSLLRRHLSGMRSNLNRHRLLNHVGSVEYAGRCFGSLFYMKKGMIVSFCVGVGRPGGLPGFLEYTSRKKILKAFQERRSSASLQAHPASRVSPFM